VDSGGPVAAAAGPVPTAQGTPGPTVALAK